jgi:uncharacterized OsmC-like protein
LIIFAGQYTNSTNKTLEETEMAAMAEIKYLGNLKTECTHLASKAKLITDAPVDNRGEGSSFSATDLCAASLGICALTIMGIYAREHDVDITDARVEVVKTMQSDPRRIKAVDLIVHMPDKGYTDNQKKSLMRAADTCPVRLTLDSVEQSVTFNWAE